MTESGKKAREIVRKQATHSWLASLHKRVIDAQLEQRALRSAPDEVVHRRINGETVISRRLYHRSTKREVSPMG